MRNNLCDTTFLRVVFSIQQHGDFCDIGQAVIAGDASSLSLFISCTSARALTAVDIQTSKSRLVRFLKDIIVRAFTITPGHRMFAASRLEQRIRCPAAGRLEAFCIVLIEAMRLTRTDL